jgi:hypothetical protein
MEHFKCMAIAIIAASAAGLGWVSPAAGSPIVSQGTLTNEIYNDAGASGNYTNASSINVSTTNDLLVGLSPLATNYVGNNEAAGGNLGVLTDGQTASNPSNKGNASLNASEPTSAANAAFDLGAGALPWYAVWQLPSSARGYTITSGVVTTGHQDSRCNQEYDLLVSSDGTNFYSLSDDTDHTLPSPSSGAGSGGVGFTYDPSSGHGGAAQSTVSPSSGTVLATGVNYVEFVELSSGNDIYREVGVFGTPTPEPAALALLSFAGLGLLARRRARLSGSAG